MEGSPKIDAKFLTVAALLAFGFSEYDLKAAGLPAEKKNETADYTVVNEVVADQPAKQIETSTVSDNTFTKADSENDTLSERRTNLVRTEKTVSTEAGGHTYTVQVSYINGQPSQYKFTDKDSLKTVTTIDGGQEILIGDSIIKEKRHDDGGDYEVVFGRSAHREFTRPDGHPDIMTITTRNGSQIVLKCKYGKDGSSTGDWSVVMEGKVKPANEDAKAALVKRALENHQAVPFKFKKEGDKSFMVSPERASD